MKPTHGPCTVSEHLGLLDQPDVSLGGKVHISHLPGQLFWHQHAYAATVLHDIPT